MLQLLWSVIIGSFLAAFACRQLMCGHQMNLNIWQWGNSQVHIQSSFALNKHTYVYVNMFIVYFFFFFRFYASH